MTTLLLHTRYRFLETVRVPIAAIGTIVFPAMFMLLFVVTNRSISADPRAATLVTGQLAFFAVTSAAMFNLGAAVAEDRAQPWQYYLRTLPVGPGAQLGGRVLTAVLFAVLSLIPVALTGVLFTSADTTLPRVGAAVVVLLLAATPFVFLGLAIGYSLPLKAAVPVVQLVLFPMSFAGGLFIPPMMFPGWLDAVSRALPTRAGRDMVVGTLTGAWPGTGTVLVAVAWALGTGVLAVVAFRRDEGRRFR